MTLVVLAIHNKLLSQAIALVFLSECSRNVNLTVSPVAVYDLNPVSTHDCDNPHIVCAVLCVFRKWANSPGRQAEQLSRAGAGSGREVDECLLQS